MCISDWRIGRLIRSVGTVWNTGSGVGVNIPPNKQRVGLTFAADANGAAVSAAAILTFTGGGVLVIGNGRAMTHITLLTHGDLPTRGGIITTVVSLSTGAWIEYLLPEECLAAGLEEFKRQYGIK